MGEEAKERVHYKKCNHIHAFKQKNMCMCIKKKKIVKILLLIFMDSK